MQVLDVPRPVPGATEVLVRTVASVISPGTERAVTALAQSSLLAKARARPDLVRQVIRKARADGLAVDRAGGPEPPGRDLPLGYSAAGVVLEAGPAVTGVRPGQLVATGGAGKANHAEFQVVPGLLCATVPDGVTAEDAAFTTIAVDRPARPAARRGRSGLKGGGARAGPDRPAGGAAGHCGRLRRGWHRPSRTPAPGSGRLRRAGPGRTRGRDDRSRYSTGRVAGARTPSWFAPQAGRRMR